MGTLQFRLVDCQRHGDIAVLLVNDPPANTLTYDLVRQLEDVFFEVSRDPSVRAVVLSGAGERFFSGGVNIGMLRSVSPHFNSNFILYAAEVFELIDSSPLLIVAAINGHVTGGGLELALIADKRVAVEGTYNFGFPEVKLGVIPGLGGTQRLSRIIGPHKARSLITHGEFIPVSDAKALGIVDAVLPKADFLAQAIDYTRTLLDRVPSSVRPRSADCSWQRPDREIASYARTGPIGEITLAGCAEASALQALWALNMAILEARLDDAAEVILLKHVDSPLQLGQDAEPDSDVWDYAQYVFRRLQGFPRLCVLACADLRGVLASELALACDYWLVPGGTEDEAPLLSISPRSRHLSQYAPRPGGGEAITLQRMFDLGIAKSVDREAWPQSARDWLGRFVAPHGASKSIGYAKLAVVQGASLPPEAGMLLERHLQEQLFRSHDASEGMKAYLEKRNAVFRGE